MGKIELAEEGGGARLAVIWLGGAEIEEEAALAR